VSDFEAYMQLGFDLWQLAGLLWLTGGITNPFSILFLAPVVTAATTLSRWVVLALGVMALTLSFGLVFYHLPLPWSPAGSFDLPLVLKLGIWMAILVGASFTSFYAWRATHESRRMAFALATTEAMLAHEQKLSALGGLAAAAAHELGTPLATIQVVAKEMSREVEADTPLGEDAALILSQAQRCRDILEQLSRRGDEGDIIHDALSIEDLLEEAAEPFIDRDKDIVIQCDGDGPDPVLKRRPELLYALKNYIDNAVDFAATRVELSAHWTAETITILVDDDGIGFDPALKDRLGQPYASTRHRAQTAGGLGLGVFISGRLMKCLGGKISYQTSPLGGARILTELPRDRLSA
jgi:two-component system sensor histidine kinase RegB